MMAAACSNRADRVATQIEATQQGIQVQLICVVSAARFSLMHVSISGVAACCCTSTATAAVWRHIITVFKDGELETGVLWTVRGARCS